MPDIGLGELIVIAIVALLVFGPDRLPKVAADAARTLRQVRQMATAARRDLADAAGLEKDPELAAAVRDLRDLDPRRVLEPLEDTPGPAAAPPTGPGAAGTTQPRSEPSSGGRPAVGQEASPAAGGGPASPAASPSEGGAPGGAATAAAPGGVDPDWT